MLDAVTRLADPAAVARNMPWLVGKMAKIALGRSDLWFDERDTRFADKAWQRQARTRFLASLLTAVVCPANYLARGRIPRAADRERFPVGQKIAATPGAVVYREEMFELLQYAPTTDRVHAVPLLMVPPQVNRYYVLDLASGRSVVEFAVAQGIRTFMMAWRNPRASLGYGRWGVDDYVAAQERAAEVVRIIARSDTLSWPPAAVTPSPWGHSCSWRRTTGSEWPGRSGSPPTRWRSG